MKNLKFLISAIVLFLSLSTYGQTIVHKKKVKIQDSLIVNGNIKTTGTLNGTSATFSGNVTASNLSGTNTGDQTLPTDFVSAANGGTFSGPIAIDDSVGAAWLTTMTNSANNGHGLLIQAGGTSGTRYITQWKDAAGTERFHMDDTGEAYFQKTIAASNFSGTSSGTNTGDQDLSGYLPLAGGTLTGTLNGTDASFAGNVEADKFITGQLEINSDLNATNIVSDDENLYIKSDHTSGNVRLIADAAIYVQTGSSEDLAITASSSSGVGLWHIGSKKIGTTTTGASVTGNLEVSGTILPETNNVQTITGTTSSATIGANINVVVVDTTVNCTLTIAATTNIASIKVINVGTGNVYLSAGTSVTVNDNGGHVHVASSNKLYDSAALTKIATNSWIVSE